MSSRTLFVLERVVFPAIIPCIGQGYIYWTVNKRLSVIGRELDTIKNDLKEMNQMLRERSREMKETDDMLRSCREEMKAVGVLCQVGMKEKEEGLGKGG
ncbi:MAG: hypothetical protein Q9192_004589 [Flavoplaca navasiana]